MQVLEQRVTSGHWDGTTMAPHRLNALAGSLDLGEAAFVRVETGESLADRTWPEVESAAATAGR